MSDDNSSESSSPKLRQEEPCVTSELEKKHRRRLQNRVASQSARARRKAKVVGLEQDIQILIDKNNSLSSECTDLKDFSKKLAEENAELRDKLQNQSEHVSSKLNPNQQRSEACAAVALNAKTVVALWEQVSSIQIPECNCNEIPQAVVTKRINTKKYKAFGDGRK